MRKPFLNLNREKIVYITYCSKEIGCWFIFHHSNNREILAFEMCLMELNDFLGEGKSHVLCDDGLKLRPL